MQETLEILLYRAFRFNPAVVILELRTRLRGERPFVVLFVFALIAALTLIGTLTAGSFVQRSGGGNIFRGGTMALLALCLMQLSLIRLIMPAYAGSSIALEREKKTIELLQTSLLSPTDVVSGKMLTISASAGMLLLATLPVAAWCLMLGGVSPLQLFMAYTYLLVCSLEVIAFGLLISTTTDRVLPAVVATYVIMWFGGGMVYGLAMVPLLLTGGGSSSTLGTGGAVLLLLIAVAVFSGLLYMLLRGLMRRFPSLKGSVAGITIPAAVAIIAGLALVALGATWLPKAASWNTQVLMFANPQMALYSILGTGFASARMSGGGASASSMPPGLLVWLLNMGIGVLATCFLWLLAINNYRRRSQRA